MRKIYHYKDLSFKVSDETDVNLSVEFVSEGNTGLTLINVPESVNPVIADSGIKFLGKGKDLRCDTTVCVSDIANLIPKDDEIKVRYKINGQLLLEHLNVKSEEQKPVIVLFIRFPGLENN